jgi:membrane fusion protein (multidrug efflux system)
VDEGQYVNAGTSLFKINDLPYQAALNNALAAQHAAEAAAANAQLEINKLAPLVENKVVADYQLKTAQSAYDVAKANIDQAKANVATAQINLGYTTIKAPVNGYIGRLARKQGSLVAPGDPVALTQLSDVQNVHVYFSLSEDDFVQFKAQYPGNTLAEKIKHVPAVQLILSDRSTYGQTGHLDIFDGQFDKSTGAITVRATFANPQGLLRAGNTGRLRLSLSHPNSLAIPQSATLELQDKIYAFKVIDSNKVSKTPLTVIGKTGRNYLISDGLKAGDRIVLTNLDRLQDGIVIQPVNSTTNTATK